MLSFWARLFNGLPLYDSPALIRAKNYRSQLVRLVDFEQRVQSTSMTSQELEIVAKEIYSQHC